MNSRLVFLGALVLPLCACAHAPPPQEANTIPRATTSPSRSDAAPAASPREERRRGSAAGVVFDVAPEWTVLNEGSLSVAKSPSGDAGFVVAGFDDPGEGPTALHRADKEFATVFPTGTASLSRQLPLGTLPYGFLLDQSETVKGDRIVRLSVLMGRGVKTKHLVVLAYVNVPKANAQAEGERVGRVFETMFQTFAPAS